MEHVPGTEPRASRRLASRDARRSLSGRNRPRSGANRPDPWSRQTTPRTAAPAFTLVEMLVVLMVLALAAAMVLPYASTSESQAVSAAQMAASDLQYAQSLAITTQLPTTVTFSVANRSYTLSNQSGTLIHPMTGKPYVVDFRTMQGFQSVVVQGPVFGAGSTVTFDATGAPDNAGSATVRAGGNAYRLDVGAATGNVTVTRLAS